MSEDDQTEQTNDTDAQAVADEKEGQGEGPDDSAGGSDDYATGRDPEVGKLRKEAAGYRTKLRETETKLERAEARISDYDRAEVERQVGDRLQNPSDLWLTGVQLDELRGEDGSLEPEKVKAARDKVIEEHPHWQKPAPDFGQGARQPANERRFSFGEALKKEAAG